MTDESLTLTASLRPAALDARRGIVRLHPEILTALGLRAGDPVRLVGRRETAGIVALAESGEHDPVNIGNPDEYTLLELAEAVIEVTGSSSEIVYEALPMDDPKVRQPDITRARDLLGWEPKMSLREGLRRTIDQAGVEMLVGTSR